MDYSLCDTDCDELLKRYRVALSREEVQVMVEETYAFLAMQMGVDYLAHQPKDGLRKRIGEDLDERGARALPTSAPTGSSPKKGSRQRWSPSWTWWTASRTTPPSTSR